MNKDHTPHEFIALAVIPTGIALNLALGTFVTALKLPIYLDAVGTIIVTVLVGWRAGIVAGAMSFALAAVLYFPPYALFVGTQAVIALYVHLTMTRRGPFVHLWHAILAGIGLGVAADVMSAPVIAWAFKGVTGTVRDLLFAALVNYKMDRLSAVFVSGLVIEPIDKTIQLLLGYFLILNCPQRVLRQFPRRASVAVFGTGKSRDP